MAWSKPRSHHRAEFRAIRRSRDQRIIQDHLLTTRLSAERLEPRTLLAGLPTLIDIIGGAGASSPSLFTNVNNTVFFEATDATHGRELWKSDGTAAGTKFVKDIIHGGSGSQIRYLTNVNGTLFFRATADNRDLNCGKATGPNRVRCGSKISRSAPTLLNRVR
jgi:ELWxxDGT repeat protein